MLLFRWAGLGMWDTTELEVSGEVGEAVVLSGWAVEPFSSETTSIALVDGTVSEADVGPKGVMDAVVLIEPLAVLGLLLLSTNSWATVEGEVSEGRHVELVVASWHFSELATLAFPCLSHL